MIQSPLNYTGGKYKLLPQILPLFPKDIDVFVDLFCGGCNVGINVDCNRVIYNDLNENLLYLYNTFKNLDKESILEWIYEIIEKYNLSLVSEHGYDYYGCESSKGLGNYNREGYLRLRADFNQKHVNENFDYYYYVIYTSESEYESNIPLDEKIITVKSKKPDKDVLINICNQENCSISDAAYIGDSLTKDVYMAKLANITSIWANYPKEKNNYYDLLVDITSWTEDDFIREKELKKQYISFGIKPDYTISKFSQLLPIILQEK